MDDPEQILNSDKTKKISDVNKRYDHFSIHFLAAKITSYFYFGSKYLLMTYLVPYFTSTGLHPVQAGIIISVRYIVQVIGGLLLSGAADRTKKYKFFTILAILMISLSMIAMPFLSHTLKETHKHKVTNNTSGHAHNINTNKVSENATVTTKLFSNTPEINDTAKMINNYTLRKTIKTTPFIKKMENRNSLETYLPPSDSSTFYISLICCAIYAFFDGSLNGMVDATTISTCTSFGKTNSYYWQRLWGSVGYATVPLLGGLLLDHLKTKFISEYMPIFYLFYALQCVMLLSFIFLLKEFQKVPSEDTLIEEKLEIKTSDTLLVLRQTLAKPEVFICLILQIFFGIGTGIEFSYLLMYMEGYMENGTTTMLGFAILSQCLTEALFSPVVGKINKLIVDPFVSMTIGLVGYGIGFFCYYYSNNGLNIIVINIIFGISYLMFNFPAQSECYRLCPKQCLAIVFSLSASCYTGIGCAIGGLLGGILYEKVGPRKMYIMTSFNFLGVAVCLFIYCLFRKGLRTSKNKEVLLPSPTFV